MNPRILEIALECYNPYGNFDLEKFAQLMVRECAEVANKNRTVMEIKTNTHLTADAIKEHFGVKE
jgi:hypothetical protein